MITAIVLLGVCIAGSTFLVLQVVNKNQSGVASSNNVNSDKSNLVALDLGDAITANVYEENGIQHIARIEVSFGLNQDSKAYKKFTENFPSQVAIIRNEIIQTLREQTYDMMSKTDAQTKLGDEIIVRVNKLLDTNIIEAVYFKEFFVQ